ncbi:MAG: peptidylprolyl isomerase [Bacteroidales bacterium]|nr:peptidylprolyl isomerase [Bacteroidales bacterium]
MAILEKIRNRAGVFVIIFVGVALFLFVIDPSTFDALFRKVPNEVAKIDGTKIAYEEYLEVSQMHEEWLKIAQQTTNIDAETMNAVREQTWNDIVRKYILEDNLDELGIKVSEEEMEDMLWGNHIHSIIQTNFTNPNTNRIDTAMIQQYFNSADQDASGQQTFVTNYLKKMIIQDRLITKYNTSVSKGLYVPKFVAKDDYESKTNKVNFALIARNYKEIADEEIKFSDAELEDYFKEHIERYQVEEDYCDIEYVVFEVNPSQTDTANVLTTIKNLQKQFAETETPKIFVNQHSDQAYHEEFLRKEELPLDLQTDFFESEKGTVTDIYFDNGSFKISRMLDRKVLPDSVRASHILIRQDSLVSLELAHQKIDSLKSLIDNGASFEQLAMTHSQDPANSPQGGDLGWFEYGAMVKPFNDVCFENTTGHIEAVETQYGVHLLKITDQAESSEMISIATISKRINYSTETFQRIYAKASTFSAENNTASSFDKAVVEQQLVKRIANKIKENDIEIRGLSYPREIIRWAFKEDVEKGSISPVFELENMFVVAKLTAKRKKGNAEFEDVKKEIEPIIIQKKKAEKFIAEFNEDLKQGLKLSQISSKYNLVIDTAKNISFNTFSLPKQGIEPKVIATAVYMANDVISKPIEGNNGVYIIKPIQKTEAPAKEDYSTDQLTLMNALSSRASYQAYEAMKKKAEIEDMRSNWF